MTQPRLSSDHLIDITTLAQPLAWVVDALCAQVDTDGFFPINGGSAKPAKSICAKCPVTEPCLEYALEHESGEQGTVTSYGPWGVYGGKSPSERKKIIRERQGRVS